FDNKLNDSVASFVLQKITLAKGDVDFTGTVFNQDISFVTYEDFGAVGNGKLDDFEAIYKTHVFANISGQVVKATAGKTYYIHNPILLAEGDKSASPKEIPIQTNVIWDGAYFIIDDSTISVLKGEHGADFYNYNIFTVIPNEEHELITLSAANGNGELIESLKGNINRSTTKINIPSSEIKDWEGDIMIIPYNSSHKVYRRRGYGGFEGGSMHEVIVIDKDGNVSAETPIMYDYTNLNYVQVYRLDESSAITLQGGTFETKASSTNCVRTLADGSLDAAGGYINRGIEVSRSYTLVKDIKHKITGEIKLTEQVDSDGKIIKCGAAYHGFFAANDANHVTFEDCELMGRRCFARPQGGTQGTYDLTGNEVNKIVFKNCIQTNFWVTVVDGSAVPADENTPGALPSMASYTVGSKSLKMHWGIGGTNYCKNMEYIGSTLSRFDAHAGLYNGKVIDSTVNYLAITGNGNFIVHNTRYFAEGTGYGSNSLFHLRSDYGSTWEGDIDLKNVDAYVYTSAKTFLFYHNYQNWYFGYQACFPSISIDNLNYYSISSRMPLAEGYQIYLADATLSPSSKMHLPESHTNAIFSILDQDRDSYCDTCHAYTHTTVNACDECIEERIDGLCDRCGKDFNIARCQTCVDSNFDRACDVCKTEYKIATRCTSCTDGDADGYCDVCAKKNDAEYCNTCKDTGNGWVDEPLYDRDLDGKIDGPVDLDGDGVIGNTNISYTDIINSGEDIESGKASGISKVNLNMIRLPEYIKIINNDGVDNDGDGIGDTGGYIFRIRNTGINANDPAKRISNGGYWGVAENWGGFLGSTKFYYGNGENDYFQGTNYPNQKITETFDFY
ncbi:MAG: hypothetical protein J6Q69_06370, partial [Clostridia bacterium]|nr:hypothetical protein [Clostridia bacterium]